MRELRAAAAHGRTPEARAELRRFAAEWPGALRELDTITDEELARRLAACEAGDDAAWIAWMARYHELMRTALALRRGDPAPVDEAFARAVARPRHGRLNAVIFARLAQEFAVEKQTIWDTLFPPRGRIRRGYRQ